MSDEKLKLYRNETLLLLKVDQIIEIKLTEDTKFFYNIRNCIMIDLKKQIV